MPVWMCEEAFLPCVAVSLLWLSSSDGLEWSLRFLKNCGADWFGLVLILIGGDFDVFLEESLPSLCPTLPYSALPCLALLRPLARSCCVTACPCRVVCLLTSVLLAFKFCRFSAKTGFFVLFSAVGAVSSYRFFGGFVCRFFEPCDGRVYPL